MSFFIYIAYLIPTAISLISAIKVKINGSDQVYHILMIDAIRKNNNQFIKSMPFFVGKNVHAYPQFLHWFFSFISEKKVLNTSKYLGTIFNTLTAISLFIFAKSIYNQLTIYNEVQLDYNIFMVSIGLIYSTSPILYDLVNSKNMGFSARGLGLFLGHIFLYLFIYFLLTNSYIYLLLSIVVVILIILSSVFAFQFILFFTFFYSIFTLNLTAISIPIIASLLLYSFIPNTIHNYFTGQFNHKYIYFKYLAPVFILKHRYSIWRDIYFDFFVKIKDVFEEKRNLLSFGKYVITNPLINLIIGIPVILLVFKNSTSAYINNILSLFIFCTVLIFIATSFRLTRFLGEPERYVEFILPILALKIILIQNFSIKFLLIIVLICFLLIFIKLYFAKKYLKSSTYIDNTNTIKKIQFFINNHTTSNLKQTKVVCQNTQLSKLLFSKDYQIFRHPLFQSHIGNFSFEDIHSETYDNININVIPELIKAFDIDILILNSEKDLKRINSTYPNFSEINYVENLVLIRV